MQRTWNRAPAIPVGMQMQELETGKRVMNKIMMKYIEQVRMDPNMHIRDRSWFQRMLNRAPDDVVNMSKPVLFKDHWGAFSKTLMMGMDFDFLMMDVVILCFMDRETIRHPDVTSRVCLAVMMAFIVNHLLYWIRDYLGRRNLSKHTLADEAFLL